MGGAGVSEGRRVGLSFSPVTVFVHKGAHKMNTGRAKKIRKSIYGDTAHKPVKYVKDSKGTIRAVGLRRHYQEVKGAWND